MAEPARRPQSQPAGAGSGGLDCLAPSKGGSGTRPQTAQVRMPEAPRAARAAFRPPVSRPQSTSSIRPGSTAGFDPALTARTPPWVFTQSVDPLSNLMLKKEYMAMADKAREDELFVQKLNKHNPPPQVTHMKKDWRYYQHCGSKGNVWSDLHMTPEDRRHLVVTPTVLKGYDVQMRTVAKHLHAEEEAKAARLEKVAYERNVRRFRLTEQVKAREVLEVRASQRPATAEYRAAQQGEFGQDDAAFPEGMASGTRPTAQESRPATAHAASKAWQAQQAVEDAAPTGPGDGEHEENPAAAAHLSSMALHDDAGGGPCPVYGVHIDYPVEYDFNAMGSGLEREDTITAPGCGRRMGRGGGEGHAGAEPPRHLGQKPAQPRPATSLGPSRPSLSGGLEGRGQPSWASGGAASMPTSVGGMAFGLGGLKSEVARPASAMPGRPFQAFAYTTMLTEDEWVRATARRENTRAHWAWQLQRPDLNSWAQAQADARAALEVQYLAQKRDILQGKRQERRVALMGRVRDREALEIDAGQAKARKRAAAARGRGGGALGDGESRLDPRRATVWRPVGYGQNAEHMVGVDTAASVAGRL